MGDWPLASHAIRTPWQVGIGEQGGGDVGGETTSSRVNETVTKGRKPRRENR